VTDRPQVSFATDRRTQERVKLAGTYLANPMRTGVDGASAQPSRGPTVADGRAPALVIDAKPAHRQALTPLSTETVTADALSGLQRPELVASSIPSGRGKSVCRFMAAFRLSHRRRLP